MAAVINTNSFGVKYASALTVETPDDVPVWDPEGLHKEWGDWEVYMGKDKIGPGHNGRFVPNVNDKVWSPTLGTRYVKELNPTTLIPTLARAIEPVEGGADSKDWLLGIGDRWPQQGFFVYADNQQDIPRISIDAQGIFRHPSIAYFRLYGMNPDDYNEILSAWYNQSGEYINNQIPRVLVDSKFSKDGYQYYVPDVFWGTRELIEGEEVKLVGYSNENSEIAEASFVVRLGSSVRRGNQPVRRISSIELVTPYLSTTEENRIRIPVGTNIASIAMMCKLNYDNGQSITLPIDGVKVRLQGLEETVSSSPGFMRDIILYYYLGDGEVYIGADTNTGKATVKVYTVEVDPSAQTYGFKLFGYPSWVNEKTGYHLNWFLHDYDHSQVYDVTNLVELTSNSAVWDPLLMGTKQYLRVALDVNKVDPRYSAYRHAQAIQFTLLDSGLTDIPNHWRVYYEDGQNPAYGDNCKANLTFVSSQVWSGDLSCGAKSLDEWLNLLYYRTHPLFDPKTQSAPSIPTHFIYTIRGQRYRHPISDWNKVIQVKTGGAEGECSVIHFVLSTNGVDLYLSTAGLFTHQIIKG